MIDEEAPMPRKQQSSKKSKFLDLDEKEDHECSNSKSNSLLNLSKDSKGASLSFRGDTATSADKAEELNGKTSSNS